jgi:hypothetical protein
MRWLVPALAALSSHVLASAKRVKVTEMALPLASFRQDNATFDCELLNGLAVQGHDFSSVAKMVCQHWPAQFGRFPFSEVNGLTGFLDQVFNPLGLWNQFQADLKSDNRNHIFCMRKEVMREVVPSTMSQCPEIITNDIKQELEADVDEGNRTFAAEGNWACQDQGSMCDCARRDSLEEVPNAQISSRPQGCDMVHQNQCYGKCPYGYAPTWLAGAFRPVCTSICGHTHHPYGCGFGCANSRVNCALVFIQQVFDVAAAVGRVVSYVTVNIVDKVKRAVEGVAGWTLRMLPVLTKIVGSLWGNFTRAHQQAGLLMALMQVVTEAQQAQGVLQPEIDKAINATQEFFLELFDAELGWDSLNLQWVANVLLKKGEQIVQEAWGVLGSFDFNECEVASTDVHFSVEDVGDDRLIGPWMHRGWKNGKPMYQLIGNGDTFLEWHTRENAWKMFLLDRTCCTGWWFGWIGLGWRELYRSTSPTPIFPADGWRRVEGPNPLPVLVAAQN